MDHKREHRTPPTSKGHFIGETRCEFGLAAENMSHMLLCSLLSHPCILDDILILNMNEIGYECTAQ